MIRAHGQPNSFFSVLLLLKIEMKNTDTVAVNVVLKLKYSLSSSFLELSSGGSFPGKQSQGWGLSSQLLALLLDLFQKGRCQRFLPRRLPDSSRTFSITQLRKFAMVLKIDIFNILQMALNLQFPGVLRWV